MTQPNAGRQRTVLVTGGCGFIGSHFVQLVRRERPYWRVVNVDKLTYAGSRQNLDGVAEGDTYRLVHGDVSDAALMTRVFEEEHPRDVVHLAAESHVDRSILDAAPFLQTNVMGTQVLLEAARVQPVERFLYVSTDEVYGDQGPDGPPASERAPFNPSSPYAASKAGADLLANAYHRTHAMPILIIRLCNQYGPRQFPEKLIPFMVHNVLEGANLPLYGDGTQVRDWMFVEDGARAILEVLERGEAGCAYNVAAHESLPNRDVVALLCRTLAELLGRPAEELLATIELVADRPGHDVRYALDDGKARAEVGWRPSVGLEEGLKTTAEWYLAHTDWMADATAGEYQRHHDSFYSGPGRRTR